MLVPIIGRTRARKQDSALYRAFFQRLIGSRPLFGKRPWTLFNPLHGSLFTTSNGRTITAARPLLSRG